jgi:hypothetical protein
MPASGPLITVLQPTLFETESLREAVSSFANAGTDARGAIFTRREVVDFVLDLTGYTADHPLHTMRLLEPSIGDGDFLLPAIDRLLASWREAGRPTPEKSLPDCIRAVELHHATFNKTRARVLHMLSDSGIPMKSATFLVDRWLVFADFLLAPLDGQFDFIVGNPPYVRQELIPDALMAEYRARYKTIFDRADIYVPFIERSLNLLKSGGELGFICSDRWMKNRYGSLLRKKVADDFHLKIYVDMVDTPAFHSEVIAYPAITIIARAKRAATRIAHRPEISKPVLTRLARELKSRKLAKTGSVRELHNVTSGAEPWILEFSDQLALVRRLEKDFPTIEESGCKVAIGVATGADNAFIGTFDELDVEPDRKLPLVMTKDILSGEVEWRGLGVINPFGDDGRLVDLADYPKLKEYLEARKAEIAGRYVAQKTPGNWYRTIDRIYPALTKCPKLLIPDIKGDAQIVYDPGKVYPHHNLYFITSNEWNLHALQAVLLSGIARLFVATYSTKMRGGYLRFQAQYLRRIRLPRWDAVPKALQRTLIAAGRGRDIVACNEAMHALYGLSAEERVALGGNKI